MSLKEIVSEAVAHGVPHAATYTLFDPKVGAIVTAISAVLYGSYKCSQLIQKRQDAEREVLFEDPAANPFAYQEIMRRDSPS